MQINEEPLSKHILEELILESNVRLFMLQSRNQNCTSATSLISH